MTLAHFLRNEMVTFFFFFCVIWAVNWLCNRWECIETENFRDVRGFRERADRRIPEIPDKVNRDVRPDSWSKLYGRARNSSVHRPILVINETRQYNYGAIGNFNRPVPLDLGVVGETECGANHRRQDNFYDLERTRTENQWVINLVIDSGLGKCFFLELNLNNMFFGEHVIFEPHEHYHLLLSVSVSVSLLISRDFLFCYL